jgi:hypothetical protein
MTQKGKQMTQRGKQMTQRGKQMTQRGKQITQRVKFINTWKQTMTQRGMFMKHSEKQMTQRGKQMTQRAFANKKLKIILNFFYCLSLSLVCLFIKRYVIMHQYIVSAKLENLLPHCHFRLLYNG